MIVAGRREIIALGVTLALVSLVLVIVSFLFAYHYQTSRAEIKFTSSTTIANSDILLNPLDKDTL